MAAKNPALMMKYYLPTSTMTKQSKVIQGDQNICQAYVPVEDTGAYAVDMSSATLDIQACPSPPGAPMVVLIQFTSQLAVSLNACLPRASLTD
jgi:hypothetical protein